MERKKNLFEGLDTQASEAISIAQEEALGLQQEYFNTEHILLALLGMECLASRVLESLDVDLEDVQSSVMDLCTSNESNQSPKEISPTPAVRTVIRYGLEEARRAQHKLIDTGDILIGLLRQGEGIAAKVLLEKRFQLSPRKIRNELLFLP